MGKRKSKQRRHKANVRDAVSSFTPTPERSAMGHLRRAGIAYRFDASIRKLFDDDKISPSEFEALDYYRQQSQKAQDEKPQTSPMHPEKCMGGGKGGFGSSVPATLLGNVSAQIETARIERQVLLCGQVWLDMLRFIVRDENSIPQWCINRYGGRERRDQTGRIIAIVPVSEKRNIKITLDELKCLAKIIAR